MPPNPSSLGASKEFMILPDGLTTSIFPLTALNYRFSTNVNYTHCVTTIILNYPPILPIPRAVMVIMIGE